MVTEAGIAYLQKELPDCMFLYLGETDEVGHGTGWMGKEYLDCIKGAWDCIEKIYRSLPDGYTLITTADHGGHGRSHGSTDPQDMTIPICFCGKRFKPDTEIENLSIKDITPTIARLLDVPFAPEWEGTPRC